mmetsp:Transcript_19268/g.28702  ORF Transcript_19268/g.28702 Transcript_19268/m.28702 type:complete len:555 (+) Transcript_19268:113-1777(+)
MIDKRIRVYWELDNRWYWGVVQDYNDKSGEHLIKYPDCGQGADTEWLKIDVAATMGAPKQQNVNVPDAFAAIQAEENSIESSTVLTASSPNRKASAGNNKATTTPSKAVASTTTPSKTPNSNQKSKSKSTNVNKTPNSSTNNAQQQQQQQQQHPAFHPMQMTGYYPPPPHHVNAFPFSPAHVNINLNMANAMMSPYGAAQFTGHHPHAHAHDVHPSSWGPGAAADAQRQHQARSHHNHAGHGHASSSAAANVRSSFEDEVKEVTLTNMNKQRGNIGISPKAGPRTWTTEEDMHLLELIKTQGDPIKWSKIADSMSERTGKQCRERYVNHLNPNLKNTDWSPSEDATIFHLFNSMGSQWAKMSKMIPGRTDNGIKNRYHNLKRQLERDDEQRKKSLKLKDYEKEVRVDRIRDELPSNLRGNLFASSSKSMWDMHKGIHLIAANTVKGNAHLTNKVSKQFDSFHAASEDGEQCARCGLFAPSVQCGRQICNRTGWCETCTRIPPSICGNLLRECLSLRKEQDPDLCAIIEKFEDRRGKSVEELAAASSSSSVVTSK